MNRWIAHKVLLVSLITYTGGCAPQTANLTGEWEVHLRTPKGDYTMTTSIKQEGEKLNGLAWGERKLLSAKLTGTIQGDVVEGVCTVPIDNNLVQLTFSGKVSGDSIKGIVCFGGVAGGDWSAKRLTESALAGTN